jgi:N-methylhydantoinase A
MSKRIVIAVDTGGTFTDCVFRIAGRVQVVKVASTPEDPGRALLEAVARIAEQARADEVEVRHGTTVATNALLERKGARVAFVTTAGFEDTLALARQARPSLYDWNHHRTEPLAQAEMCFGVPERVGPDGEVVQALDEAALNRLSDQIRASGAESVAVSLLFGFANPAHERAIGFVLKGLGLHVSLSHHILPEFREYERASTVTINAYVAPKMERYIRGMEDTLARKLSGRLLIMQSSGGILSARAAAEEPVRTILSGPAGGVMGALSVARRTGLAQALSFDMGGTSTDVALLETAREPEATIEGEIAGLPVGVPMLEIHTAGAGGGSIASIGADGLLRVGPESAGAIPGPACYLRGGKDATVTDANLALGRIAAGHFLGGAMQLDPDHARAALKTLLRQAPAIESIEALAEGIVRVANAEMEAALRRVSVERGHDPRGFALIAFGGAGPLHACELASTLGMKQVVIPAAPGALSALGILDADLKREFARTVMQTPKNTRIARIFKELEAEACAVFSAEGLRPQLRRFAEMRYRGQGFELRVPWGPDAIARFHTLHQKRYGYSDASRPVEIVTVRVTATARTAAPATRGEKLQTGNARQAQLGTHRVYEHGHWRRALLLDRAQLHAGDRFPGPAVVTELSATTFVPSGWSVAVDSFGNLILKVRAKSKMKSGTAR